MDRVRPARVALLITVLKNLTAHLERYFEFQRLKTNWRTEILAGLTTLGTQAAVEFVCRPKKIEELLTALGAPPRGPAPAFEALLRVKISDDLKRTWSRDTRLEHRNKGVEGAFTPQLTGKYAPAGKSG